MKKKIIDIPEVNLSDVKEFWVLGSQYKDGILGEYNLKMDIKKAILGGDSADAFDLDLSRVQYPSGGEHRQEITGEEYLRELFTVLYTKGCKEGDTVKILEADGNVHDWEVREVHTEEYSGGAYGAFILQRYDKTLEYTLDIEFDTSSSSYLDITGLV